jgi:hypothetical protein
VRKHDPAPVGSNLLKHSSEEDGSQQRRRYRTGPQPAQGHGFDRSLKKLRCRRLRP